MANSLEATLPKGFHPHPTEVVEIEESPKSPVPVAEAAPEDAEAAPEDAFERTPEVKDTKDGLSPESTEKIRHIRARRSLRFPKLWWDADGKIRVGKKLRFEPHLVKTTPQIELGEEWPQTWPEDGPQAFHIGGRYFSKAKMLWEPLEDEDGSEMADSDMQAALMQQCLEEKAPSEPEVPMEEEPVLADGYETLPMEIEAATLMFPKNLYKDIVWDLFSFLTERKKSIYTMSSGKNFFPPVGAGRCPASINAKTIAREEEGSRW